MRSFAVVALVLLITASAALAQTTRPATRPAKPPPDAQDILFIANARPLRIRLHIYLDGQPLGTRKNQYLTKVFKYCDANDDGVLSPPELERAPNRIELLTQMRGGFTPAPGRSRSPQADANHDGKVTLEEFLTYYDHPDARPLAFVQGPDTPGTQALTDGLLKHLDANKDGSLSKEELAGAQKLLSLGGDDEMVGAAELTSASTPYDMMVMAQGMNGGGPMQALRGIVNSGPVVIPVQWEVGPEGIGPSRQAINDLIARYDTWTNQILSRNETAWDAKVFDAIDANRDDELTAVELYRWLSTPPELELIVRADAEPKGDKPAVEAMAALPAGVTLRPAGGGVLLGAGNAVIDVRPAAAGAAPMQDYAEFYLQQFRMADRDGKGVITLEQVESSNEYAYVRTLFKMADRDGDRKLTEKEVSAFAELLGQAPAAGASLTYYTQVQGVFELIDRNRDGRLSRRELAEAWETLAPFDADGDGVIRKAELPRQYQLVAGRSMNGAGFASPFVPTGGGAPATRPAGPTWFVKMDRNGDGDVSSREFLGTREAFRKLDANGDGLISREEAEAAK